MQGKWRKLGKYLFCLLRFIVLFLFPFPVFNSPGSAIKTLNDAILI